MIFLSDLVDFKGIYLFNWLQEGKYKMHTILETYHSAYTSIYTVSMIVNFIHNFRRIHVPKGGKTGELAVLKKRIIKGE